MKSDLSSMNSAPQEQGRQIPVDSNDLIDAIGALEVRIEALEAWAAQYVKEGEPRIARDRRDRALHLRGVVKRLQEAMR